MARWDDRARRIVARLQGVPGLTARYRDRTPQGYGRRSPWDEDVIPLNRDTLRARLHRDRRGCSSKSS